MRNRASGFTLIEMMIVIAILGIIAAIAIPNYQDSVRKGRRSDGISALNMNAQQLERCFSKYGSYDNDGCPIGDGDTIDSEEGYYSVAVNAATATFTLTATAQGAQADDTDCDTYTLTQTGAKTPDPDTDTNRCWAR